ncbi:MAG: glycerol-3-phosphate 1-O-acyltransferase PlsY [Gammaproteobacteria bacterium]
MSPTVILIINFSLILLAYLFGSFSSAVVVCKIMGFPDPRENGSNNPGATNVLRLYGKQAAFITLTGDLLKGLLPVLIGKLFNVSDLVLALMGLAAFLGHLYPVFFGFKGGKGIATFIGVLYGFTWQLGVVFMITWGLMALLFKYSSLSALVAALVSILAAGVFLGSKAYLVVVLIMVIFIFYRHRSNIQNLIDGTEDKLNE